MMLAFRDDNNNEYLFPDQYGVEIELIKPVSKNIIKLDRGSFRRHILKFQSLIGSDSARHPSKEKGGTGINWILDQKWKTIM